MKELKRFIAFILSGAAFFALPLPIFAQPVNIKPNIAPNVSPGAVISAVINLLFVVASVVAVIFLVYGGIRWIMSGGDKAAVESARNTIIAAIIGLVIVFLSWVILNFVFNFLGISLGSGFNIPNVNNVNIQ